MALKTDYKDDVLDTTVNEKRVYNLVDQSGNTVMSGLSLEDVTEYLQVGDSFGAQEINEINNDLAKKVTAELSGESFASLEEFVSATATDLKTNHMFRFKDTGGWCPKGVVNTWYRAIVMYQNPYVSGSTSTVGGSLLIWYGVSGSLLTYIGFINGNVDTDVTITWEKIIVNSDLEEQVLTFTNKTVATSAWKSSSNEDFPYYADVTCSGVTTSHVPNVSFSLADANSGIFSTVAETVSGAVRIYASEKPTATVTIPTIQCIKSV